MTKVMSGSHILFYDLHIDAREAQRQEERRQREEEERQRQAMDDVFNS